LRYVIALDPGSKYGIAVIEIATLKVMIYEAHNFAEFRKFCQSGALDDCFIAIEEVHALYGVAAAATFGFGRNLGIWTGFFLAFDRAIDTQISPSEWQSEYLALPPPIPRIKKSLDATAEEEKLRKKHNSKLNEERKKVIKAISIAAASKFTGYAIKRDGPADAVNIGRYALKYEFGVTS
jgi:hypothetical protein